MTTPTTPTTPATEVKEEVKPTPAPVAKEEPTVTEEISIVDKWADHWANRGV